MGLIGGGYVPMPGKVSLANQKMLYLMSNTFAKMRTLERASTVVLL